jgi:hypothetical protein
MSLTPEQEERLRELYRKNYLALILLPPAVLADEFPELPQPPSKPIAQESHGHRTEVD